MLCIIIIIIWIIFWFLLFLEKLFVCQGRRRPLRPVAVPQGEILLPYIILFGSQNTNYTVSIVEYYIYTA